ncbi:class I SAM-dependent methyltransferase [Luteimonas terricola]|uniref:class I SAM-dependent methyltransferase n=1 Tax=Luteimonas terricola TaxID=645597 RepID=UPI0010503A2A|nr:class I SAM-dependent methyltransferase [Luteimonas terricola]
MRCRLCSAPLRDVFLDLGSAPPSNAYLTAETLTAPETWFPLKLFTCRACFLVQVDEVQSHEALFPADYAYFSSYSSSWLEHARGFVDAATNRLGLGHESLVLEVASNDGYLLQYVADKGIPCVGIEPTSGTAAVSRGRGIETIEAFFGQALARELAGERGGAELIVANNVLAHVPDLNDFIAGLAIMLAQQGSLSIEFPHLQRLIEERQFDTVYHEHFSYFSLHTVLNALVQHGLRIWDVERLTTHGGSLRVWAAHDSSAFEQQPSVEAILNVERAAGMLAMDYYRGFQAQADEVKNDLLAFLLEKRRLGRKVAGYGAAAKGNTLLNYAGVRPDLLPYVVDASPHKQGRFLPGSRIPVVSEARIRETQPDYVVILPWNLRDEITAQLAYIREWNGKFLTVIPKLQMS